MNTGIHEYMNAVFTIFVLLIILETVLITLFTEMFEPIVKVPLELDTLNLVFTPVT